jgi:hypothetical protein
MLDPTSRYADTATAEYVGATGRRVVHLRRRFLPAASAYTPVARVVVTEGDRLDLIAARSIGDPEQYWQVCDANEAMNPAELERLPGRIVLIAVRE